MEGRVCLESLQLYNVPALYQELTNISLIQIPVIDTTGTII